MSYDLAVWYPSRAFSAEEAGEIYGRLCDGQTDVLEPDPAVTAFYTELTSLHPEIDDIPAERVDDHDLCPWSVAFDRSDAFVIMCAVWSSTELVNQVVSRLAAKHGLLVYNPQDGTVVLPASMRTSSDITPRRALSVLLGLVSLTVLLLVVGLVLYSAIAEPVVRYVVGATVVVMLLVAWLWRRSAHRALAGEGS